MEGDQETEGRGGEGKGIKKEFRCVMYMYHLQTSNVNIMHYKDVLIKMERKQ